MYNVHSLIHVLDTQACVVHTMCIVVYCIYTHTLCITLCMYMYIICIMYIYIYKTYVHYVRYSTYLYILRAFISMIVMFS